MPTWKDFTLDTVQTAVFTPANSAFSAAKVLAAILTKFRDRFDGDMQVLPIPSELNVDLPHVILKSNDNRRQLSVSPARMDSLWKNSIDSLDVIIRECAEVQEESVRETRARVGRVALVIKRICPIDNPAQELIRRFCNEASQQQPFNRSRSFEIHNHKVYTPQQDGVDYTVNSWVRCKAEEPVEGTQSTIQVFQDLNTLATSESRFDADGIVRFFGMAVIEVDDILKKYFPEQV